MKSVLHDIAYSHTLLTARNLQNVRLMFCVPRGPLKLFCVPVMWASIDDFVYEVPYEVWEDVVGCTNTTEMVQIIKAAAS